jgi:hypothetical protein
MTIITFLIFLLLAGLCFGGAVHFLSEHLTTGATALGFILFIMGCLSMSMGIVSFMV